MGVPRQAPSSLHSLGPRRRVCLSFLIRQSVWQINTSAPNAPTTEPGARPPQPFLQAPRMSDTRLRRGNAAAQGRELAAGPPQPSRLASPRPFTAHRHPRIKWTSCQGREAPRGRTGREACVRRGKVPEGRTSGVEQEAGAGRGGGGGGGRAGSRLRALLVPQSQVRAPCRGKDWEMLLSDALCCQPQRGSPS